MHEKLQMCIDDDPIAWYMLYYQPLKHDGFLLTLCKTWSVDLFNGHANDPCTLTEKIKRNILLDGVEYVLNADAAANVDSASNLGQSLQSDADSNFGDLHVSCIPTT